MRRFPSERQERRDAVEPERHVFFVRLKRRVRRVQEPFEAAQRDKRSRAADIDGARVAPDAPRNSRKADLGIDAESDDVGAEPGDGLRTDADAKIRVEKK